MASATAAAGFDFGAFKKMACEEEGWTAVTEKDAIKVSSRKIEGSAVNVARGVTIFDAPLAQVKAICESVEQRCAWDKLLAETVLVKRESDTHLWVRMRSIPYTFPPVSARVFFVEIRIDTDATTGTVTLLARDGTHDGTAPAPTKGTVLGKCIASGFVIERVSDTQTKVTYVVQLDLSGWIPTSIVNKAMLEEPLCLNNIRRMLTPAH